jgi:DNA-directed RNA polymerase specialized sigma24 family protein
VHSFGVLGRVFNPIANPRGYLTRVATNLWIDAVRRRKSKKFPVFSLMIRELTTESSSHQTVSSASESQV